MVSVAAWLLSCAAAEQSVAVFKSFHCVQGEGVGELNVDEAIYNLADDANVGYKYVVTDSMDLDKVAYGRCGGEGPHAHVPSAAKASKEVVVVVNGVEFPAQLFQGARQPLYEVDVETSNELSQLQSFVRELATSGQKLSSEVTLMTQASVEGLKATWGKYFNTNKSNVERMWEDLKSAFGDESVLRISKRSLATPSIGEFLNEATQLDYFLTQDVEGTVVVTLDSPLKLYKNAKDSYETAMESLAELLGKAMAAGNVDVTVVALPVGVQTLKQAPKSKRDQQLGETLAAGAGCFKSQVDCIDSTNSCSSHGLCSNLNGCWQCVCSSSFANEQTTYWTGASCEKVDYSSQFNLLFWTVIVLVGAMVAGVKLMYNAGQEEMPGVLLAATVQTKKTT